MNGAGVAILSRCEAGWADVFRELDARAETDLLRIIRPNEKVAIRCVDDAAEIELRARLDRGLDMLTLLDLGASIGCLELTQLEAVFDGEHVPRRLFESAAFRRYLNYY